MKKLVEEVSGEGFVGLLGKNVLIWCMNYIYTGVLVGVNDTFIKLEKPKVVYATGDFNKTTFDDAQALKFDKYIQISAIESYEETDKR